MLQHEENIEGVRVSMVQTEERSSLGPSSNMYAVMSESLNNYCFGDNWTSDMMVGHTVIHEEESKKAEAKLKVVCYFTNVHFFFF